MSKARLVITAVTVEKRSVSEVARTYGVARSWVYALLARCRAEGEAAFEPRSPRPKTSPTAISDAIVELIVRLRKDLAGQGVDAEPTRTFTRLIGFKTNVGDNSVCLLSWANASCALTLGHRHPVSIPHGFITGPVVGEPTAARSMQRCLGVQT